jgi:hypothetical protein
MDDATKRANEDLRRYNAQNLARTPDFARIAEEYASCHAPAAVRGRLSSSGASWPFRSSPSSSR